MSERMVTGAMRSEAMHSVLPLLLVLARRSRLLVGVPVAAGIAAIAYSLLAAPIYTATARILPPQYNENTVMAMQNQLGGDSQLGNAALTLSNPTDLFVGILSSRTIMDGVIDAMELDTYYEVDDLFEARRALSAATTIRAAKDGIVSIAVEDTDRGMAADLANTYVNEFYDFSASLARDQSGRRSQFYAVALDAARDKLALADLALMETEKDTGYTRLMGQDQAIVLAAADLQAQISAREIQLQTMTGYATDSNPHYQLIESELGNLRRELGRLRGVEDEEPIEGPADQNPFVVLGLAPDALLAHTRTTRDVEYWEDIVMLIGRFSELGKIDERRDMSLFQVLDWAVPPFDKSKPRTRVNAILAGIGAGFACLFWVLACAYVDQRREQSSQFEQQWRELVDTLRRSISLDITRSRVR
jgi:uncharacterized protein involved in exopolysaccharide biosynthesis